MNHRVRGRKLGRTASHRKAMLGNLVTSLILHGRVKTTLARAKEVRSLADKLVTLAKRGDLSARRLACLYADDKHALRRLFDDIGPRFRDRVGGYSRFYKCGFRAGDNAPLAYIEYLGEEKNLASKMQAKTEKHEKKKAAQEKKHEHHERAPDPKETKKGTKFHEEEKHAVESEAAHKGVFRRQTSKGTGRSGGSKKGVS